jgi:hypothetical protein
MESSTPIWNKHFFDVDSSYIMLVIYSFVTDEIYRFKDNNINDPQIIFSCTSYEMYQIKRRYKINVLGSSDQYESKLNSPEKSR